MASSRVGLDGVSMTYVMFEAVCPGSRLSFPDSNIWIFTNPANHPTSVHVAKNEKLTHVIMTAKIPLGSSAHFCRMGTENAIVLPVPVLEPPIQSFPFRISGIQDA